MDNDKLSELYDIKFETIDVLNEYLVNNNYESVLIDYIKLIHNNFNANTNLILLNNLNRYIIKDNEFCIDAELYYKYRNIYNKHFDYKNYNPKSIDILRVLNKSNLTKDKDYILLSIEQKSETSKEIKYKNSYILNPKAFKKILINIDIQSIRIIFIEYYIFIEECIKYFNNYIKLKLIKNYKEKLINNNKLILKPNMYITKKLNDNYYNIDRTYNYKISKIFTKLKYYISKLKRFDLRNKYKK
jgi:hypothetical protein